MAKGEGSRGGKIIGHTKSGAPIYAGNASALRAQSERHTLRAGILTGAAVALARSKSYESGAVTVKHIGKRKLGFAVAAAGAGAVFASKAYLRDQESDTARAKLGKPKSEKEERTEGARTSSKAAFGAAAGYLAVRAIRKSRRI